MSEQVKKDNQLFPVFLRMDKLHLLVVGAGNVGWEKIGVMFKHSQNVLKITVVAPEINEEIVNLASQYPKQFDLRYKNFESTDLKGVDVAIAATNIKELNKEVYDCAKAQKVLINVADTPDLCDFYLSSIVKKGNLKIAISSNGKSPTLTKRLKEMLNDSLPEEIDELLDNLEEIRNYLKGDFEDKVNKLNAITHKMKVNNTKNI
jgi:siroheme synthase-like protein